MAVVLSAIIVIAYLSWKAVIKPPPVAEISPAETQAQAGENTVHTPAPSSTQGDFERRRLCYTFLLVASDQASANADTIMVLTYDTAEQMAGLVSIPRDTLVDRRFPKINAVYHDGIEALRGEVSRMLGIQSIITSVWMWMALSKWWTRWMESTSMCPFIWPMMIRSRPAHPF